MCWLQIKADSIHFFFSNWLRMIKFQDLFSFKLKLSEFETKPTEQWTENSYADSSKRNRQNNELKFLTHLHPTYKTSTSPFTTCLAVQNCYMYEKPCRLWSNTAFWSGLKLFAQPCLSVCIYITCSKKKKKKKEDWSELWFSPIVFRLKYVRICHQRMWKNTPSTMTHITN